VQNKFDRNGFSKRKGDTAAIDFAVQSSLQGWKVTPGSAADDYKHVDFHLAKSTENRKVDAKARKSFKRGQPPTDTHFLLEHTNVQGKEGWLRGDADFIAFQTLKGFVLAKTTELFDLWNRKVSMTKLVTHGEDAIYCIYTRSQWGRFDIISWVEAAEVMALPSTEFWETR
jgi:hypothetical protein